MHNANALSSETYAGLTFCADVPGIALAVTSLITGAELIGGAEESKTVPIVTGALAIPLLSLAIYFYFKWEIHSLYEIRVHPAPAQKAGPSPWRNPPGPANPTEPTETSVTL